MSVEATNSDRSAAAQGHLDQAYAFYEENGFEEALRECDVAIELAPALAEAHNLRGVVLEELDREEEAAESYKQALTLEPGFCEAADNLSALEAELGIIHRLVTIATFSYPTEAHLLKAKLEAEGVWSFVADEYIAAMNWLYTSAVGGVKLQVKESDAERALEILHGEPDSMDLVGDEAFVDDDDLRCPVCGSLNLYYQRFSKGPLFASWLILGFPIPFLKRKWKCGDCSHEWKP